jgi:hypothetical protein
MECQILRCSLKTMLRPVICPEALGVALIIGAWNFPFSLLSQLLVAAITARMCGLLEATGNDTSLTRPLGDLIPSIGILVPFESPRRSRGNDRPDGAQV